MKVKVSEVVLMVVDKALLLFLCSAQDSGHVMGVKRDDGVHYFCSGAFRQSALFSHAHLFEQHRC